MLDLHSEPHEQKTGDESASSHSELCAMIHRIAHYLPSQGPINVFVHHNTLHALEHLNFDEGVQAGGKLFGCHAYLPEQRYREELRRGRIRVEDLDAVLQEDLGDEADRLVANFGTRYALRLAMLQHSLHTGCGPPLRWVVAESDALRTFVSEASAATRREMLDDTRHIVLARCGEDASRSQASSTNEALQAVMEDFESSRPSSWSERTWEAFTLNYLWRVVGEGVFKANGKVRSNPDDTKHANSISFPRHRDWLLQRTDVDSDQVVHETLIRFCAAFTDQGFADWVLPSRESGLFDSFLRHHTQTLAIPSRWYAALRTESQRILDAGLTPIDSIVESLVLLGVPDEAKESYLTQTLLALRGWAGMIWQIETNAEWLPHPAPHGTLIEYLALRLVLDRLSIANIAREQLHFRGPLAELQVSQKERPEEEVDRYDRRAFIVFQLAQVRGWNPYDLQNLSSHQWETLIAEIEAFDSLERRRIYHRAYERKYRNETLDALIAHQHNPSRRVQPTNPLYQIACCIDDREESFRRHLEEVQPRCETFGIAGFFGVAMYYRGASDAHFTPLCPVNIKPAHFVVEQPVYSAVELERRLADARRRLGHATHQAHLATRTILGGALTGLFGSVAAFPLVARILFPRLTSQIQRRFGSMVHTASTELCVERLAEQPGSEPEQIGYSLDEMAEIVAGGLRMMGIAKPDRMSGLIIICGHGSSSLNNPHAAAYDCGACGGGRGGPNARAFAQMANDFRIRKLLEQRGIAIPESTRFVGGYHNTCDDSMSWYDLDRVPVPHRSFFEQAKRDIDEARKRSAHERCRRFESAELTYNLDEALRHVEGRAEDLSQTRSECGHATNALCFVGRRNWSRDLFLDRRAFLTSYDPNEDDDQGSILESMLRAVIPVCAGINLEYYFSHIDPSGYGCGTKLPHNITSLLGVMDGAASDLRPGLPWQMVELHEPLRLLFVIETTPAIMKRIIEENEAISRLVDGEWVQLAVFDRTTGHVNRYVRGEFVLYAPHERTIPDVDSSLKWYGGHRDHLGFASVVGRQEVNNDA